jgi:hypothetical protein
MLCTHSVASTISLTVYLTMLSGAQYIMSQGRISE